MNSQTGLLKSVCILGLVVFLVLLGMIIFLSVFGGVPILSSSGFGRTSFMQALEEYDQRIRENPNLSFRQHNNLLDSLEKKALDMENILSTLKRRRQLALNQEEYLPPYLDAAIRARKLYPHSAQVGILTVEALILSDLSGEAAAEIQELSALMNQGALAELFLALVVYSGFMNDPAEARFLPKELFTVLSSLFQGEEREQYLINSCIKVLLDNHTQEATAMVNNLFIDPPMRNQTILFGAEFFYDHGNFLRSAELFSINSDSQSLARQADALWLGGFNDSARGIWIIAASESINLDAAGTAGSQADEANLSSIRARSFYNLASTAPNAQESEYYLERLFAAQSDYQTGQIFGTIRYTRLVPVDRAIAVLNQTDHEREGLFDLELLRRRSEDWEINRTVAETWMLLNRHSNDERLFEWAVWYFDFQHRYEETALALRNAGINRVEGPWSALYRSLALIREGQFGEAERALRNIVRSPQEIRNAPGRRTQPLWQAAANLAVLLERQHNYEEALQYYEIAAAQLGVIPPVPEGGISLERKDASRIQLYIAGILRSLGRRPESARALDYALDLDSENLEARLEKRRLDIEQGFI